MRRLSKLSARFIGERGFSIGVDDVIPVSKLSDEVTNVTSSSYEACQVHAAPCSREIVHQSHSSHSYHAIGYLALSEWMMQSEGIVWCMAIRSHFDQSSNLLPDFHRLC